MPTLHRHHGTAPDPRLERALRRIVVIGAVLVLALPGARGHNLWFGAWPLWLLGMPLASWWALHRFRLPLLVARARARAMTPVRRRGGVQARRRMARHGGARIARAAWRPHGAA